MDNKFTLLDTNTPLTEAKARYIKSLGINAVGRYIAFGLTSHAKVIKPAEAKIIAGAGLKMFLIYETNGRPSGEWIGRRDGDFARTYAPTVGAPQGAVIYYTVDYDPSDRDLPNIVAAFRAFRQAVDGYYRVGCYGSGKVCGELFKLGLIEKRWITCSMGFSGSRQAVKDGDYDIVQQLPKSWVGLDIDPDHLHQADTDIGAFVPFVANTVPAASPIAASAPIVVTLPAAADKRLTFLGKIGSLFKKGVLMGGFAAMFSAQRTVSSEDDCGFPYTAQNRPWCHDGKGCRKCWAIWNAAEARRSGVICGHCAEGLGAKWPKGHRACSLVATCQACRATRPVFSWDDWDWPGAPKTDALAKQQRKHGVLL